jgi:hypothetical protein
LTCSFHHRYGSVPPLETQSCFLDALGGVCVRHRLKQEWRGEEQFVLYSQHLSHTTLHTLQELTFDKQRLHRQGRLQLHFCWNKSPVTPGAIAVRLFLAKPKWRETTCAKGDVVAGSRVRQADELNPVNAALVGVRIVH